MGTIHLHDVAITGIGLVTPLGCRPEEIALGIAEGRRARTPPTDFDVSGFDCPIAGVVDDSQLEHLVTDRKSIRLMGRDAFLAVAAARLAMEDSGLVIGRDAEPKEVSLYGATGLAGMPFSEIEPLVRSSDDGNGGLDLRRFGSEGLRQTRPLMSFKILSNMPICFVSIAEKIMGPNLIFNPWEGQGALAIVEAVRSIRQGKTKWVLTGGSDYRCHNIAFVTLQQYGLFESWRRSKTGLIPGEGAAFLLLESCEQAIRRKAHIYAVIRAFGHASDPEAMTQHGCSSRVLAQAMERACDNSERSPDIVFAGSDGDTMGDACEKEALKQLGLHDLPSIAVKKHVTNLFAAAAAANLALAAFSLSAKGKRRFGLSQDSRRLALVNCFGPGSEKVSFLVEAI